MKQLLLALIIILYPFSLLADCTSESNAGRIECMDFDGASPPADWPECGGATWESWTPKDWDCGEWAGNSDLSEALKYSGTRSLHHVKPADDHDATGISFTIDPAVTKLYIRYYIYFDANFSNANTNTGCGSEYWHVIFFNTAVASANFGIDYWDCTDLKPYDASPKCYSESAAKFFYGFHSYYAGPTEDAEWQIGPEDEGTCFNILDNLEEWICIEFMFDLDNELRQMWVDGVLYATRTMTEGNHSDIDWIHITNWISQGEGLNDEISYYIDNIVLDDEYIGPFDAQAATLSGTATENITETDVRNGSKELVITLSNDTWVATIGADNGITDAFIAGIDSAQSEGTGWDAEVKGNMVFGDITRTSDTVVTIVLAAEAAYNITASETITDTIPATAVTSAGEIVASPTFGVGAEQAGAETMSMGYVSGAPAATYDSGGVSIVAP